MVQEQMSGDSALRERAIKELKKRREFQSHLLIYVLVNSLLVGIWAISSPGAFFWPLFPIAGWGIGVALHGWDVYFASEPDEAQIRRMMETLQRRS
ncbi:2TM domain-containing protein [uncultured Phycicoccus sp.]|uniref:2TM domain-containing protein n=1 Tax=uncultured Phycicoccus sp. TaxID=661422 RepID=UPI002614907E|nr:2TM domain-containing protein [uncultured Phycicoccus sp.]